MQKNHWFVFNVNVFFLGISTFVKDRSRICYKTSPGLCGKLKHSTKLKFESCGYDYIDQKYHPIKRLKVSLKQYFKEEWKHPWLHRFMTQDSILRIFFRILYSKYATIHEFQQKLRNIRLYLKESNHFQIPASSVIVSRAPSSRYSSISSCRCFSFSCSSSIFKSTLSSS